MSIKEEEATPATFSLNAKAQSPIVGKPRATLTFRGNYDLCVASGVTDFGAILGDRVTFTTAEETACPTRPFWV